MGDKNVDVHKFTEVIADGIHLAAALEYIQKKIPEPLQQFPAFVIGEKLLGSARKIFAEAGQEQSFNEMLAKTHNTVSKYLTEVGFEVREIPLTEPTQPEAIN